MAVERQARAAGQTRAFIDTFMDEKGQPPSEGDLYRFTRTLKNGATGDRTGGFGWRGINPAVIAQSPWGGAIELVGGSVAVAQGFGQALREGVSELESVVADQGQALRKA